MTPSLTPKLERISGHESAIAPEAIERELASLWREAGESRGGPAAVTRACLWNVVAHVPRRPGEEGEAGAEALEQALKMLPLHLASRTLMVQTHPASAGNAPVESWVSANCILGEGGGKLVCSEEVTLQSRGDGARHLPSLVRALLVPGVPTALVSAGVPDPEDSLAAELLRICDRVIMHADASGHEAPLRVASSALQQCRMRGLDVGWMARSALRNQVAGLFDPPVTPAELAGLRRVVLRAPASEASTARLLTGWLAQSLKFKVTTEASPGRWRGQGPFGAIELALELAPGAELSITFEGAGAPRSVRCGERLVTTGCGAAPERTAARPKLEALIARALGTRSSDASFNRALERAIQL